MPITPVQPAAITRFFAVGVSQVLFCTSITNPDAPTFAELDAGTELTRDVQALEGWSTSSAFLETPDLVARFVGKIPGRIASADSSIVFYGDRLGVDTRVLLPRDTVGFVVIADGGLASGKGDVFPVQVGTLSKVRSLDNPFMVRADFAILEEPSEDVTLPQS